MIGIVSSDRAMQPVSTQIVIAIAIKASQGHIVNITQMRQACHAIRQRISHNALMVVLS